MLKVSVPDNAQLGFYEIKIQAYSQDFVSSLSFSVTISKGSVKPKVYIDTPYVEAYEGSSAKFRIEVENIGDADGLIGVNVTQFPAEYSYKLSDEVGNVLSKVFLKPQERKRLNLIVEVPSLAEPQTILFLVEAYTQDSSSRLSLTLGVLGFYSMSYETQNYYLETTAGST
ncbi:MAG: COG1470 family protein [Thermoproteota archaeon]